MTYTPKPGDRVTSPLLVGEWEVAGEYGGNKDDWWYVCKFHQDVLIHVKNLTPVAPPLPPEPAVGSVVRALGRMYVRHVDEWVGPKPQGPWDYAKWSDLATAPDLSPVVAVDDVAEWLRSVGYDGMTILVQDFRAEFGGWGK